MCDNNCGDCSVDLAKRFHTLQSRCTTRRGNKYLLPPNHKDQRWGIQHFGGCEPITETKAKKLIAKMETARALEG
ncbi:hypothetical protein LCGC14_0358790 [marine sediment metagenome]|uniref:Uncharacterized protein n=1 Tax=marine sediment metagenome TaxID=412755 RepID=A0A0F9TEF3_9ZZZZ